MVAQVTPSERRRALRSIRQRGITVQSGALEALLSAYISLTSISFPDFLDKCLDILARPGLSSDGMLTENLASSISNTITAEYNRLDGVVAASLHVIDAFAVPKWAPDRLRQGKEPEMEPRNIFIDGNPKDKASIFRERYQLVLSKTLRNQRFKPPSSTAVSMGKNSPYFQLTTIKSLNGTTTEKFVLGMLTQLEEDTWYLEDLHGTIKLDLTSANVTPGLHTDSSFVIVQGKIIEEQGHDTILKVIAMGTPPYEARSDSIQALGNDANLFGGPFDPNEQEHLLKLELQEEDNAFMFVSDVHLDNPNVIAALKHVFTGYMDDNFVPSVIVFMGHFLSHPFGQLVSDVQTLCDKFAELGTMIKTQFQQLAEQTTFIIVPGTLDPGPGNVLPRPPMPEVITRKFVEALGKDHVKLATNPCRIRYLTQEIVVLRDNLVQKMIRHCAVKPDFHESGLVSEHMVKTVIDQAYLCPLPLIARPVLWKHHHAMWLFPTPHTIVLADKVDSYICEYGGGLGLNPGSFAADFSFQMYLTSQRRAQQCSIDSEEILAEKTEENDRRNATEETNNSEIGKEETMQESEEKEESYDDREMEESEENHQTGSNDEDILMDGDAIEIEQSEQQETEPEKLEALQKDGRGPICDTQELPASMEDETDTSSEPVQASKDRTATEDSDHGDSADRDDNAEKEGSGSDESEVDEESDDDSLLIPAEKLKRIDIRELLRSTNAVEDTYPPPKVDVDNDEIDQFSDQDDERNGFD